MTGHLLALAAMFLTASGTAGEQGGGAVDPTILAEIAKSAGAGTALILILILSGFLFTRAEMRKTEKDAADWKTAAETERKARETERAANDELRATALAEAKRADAAVETARLTRELLEDLRRKDSDAPVQ